MIDSEMMAEEFRLWLEKHPERAAAALDGLTKLRELEGALAGLQKTVDGLHKTPGKREADWSLTPSEHAGVVDLINLLARALERD